jgi:hypothetical protein
MKALVIIFSILLSCSLCAQKRLFVRVYDLSGKKINSGRVLAVTDSMILLKGTKVGFDTVFVRNIGSVKTKHGVGNNIGIGIAVGTVSGILLGIASSHSGESESSMEFVSSGEIIAGSALLGMSAGALVGALSGLLKNSKHFPVNGNPANWKVIELMVTDYNAKQSINEYTN